MATITPTLTLVSNSSSAATLPGPLSVALTLSATDALAILSLAEGNKKRLGLHSQCFFTLIQMLEVDEFGYDTIHRYVYYLFIVIFS